MSHANHTRPQTIVVCAFGPAATTAAAVTRARRLVAPDGDVVVIAAHHAVPAHDRDDTAGTGPAAAETVLASARGPVLWLHDDVHAGHDAVSALHRAWRSTGAVAVPWGDAPGTDHDVDAAVPTDAAERSRSRRAAALPGQPVGKFSTTCMFGSPDQLARLAQHPLTIAGSRLHAVDFDVVAAADALVAHEHACAQADPPPEGPDGRALLVAMLIVRDEATMLGDCLASLDGLVDRIEVCDTGSQDDTVAIAERAGAHVIHRSWRDDFAWARNEVLAQCDDAWFAFQIDADERARCADPVALRRRLAALAGGIDVVHVRIDNVDDDDRTRSSHRGARIVSPRAMTYVQALHERPVRRDGAAHVPAAVDGLHLLHLGYRNDNVHGRAKAARNLAIAQSAYESEPGWETAFQYARTLLTDPRRFDEQIDALLIEAQQGGAAMPVTWRAWALSARAQMWLARDPEKALALSSDALELVPADTYASTVHIEAARRCDRPELVVANRTHRLESRSVEPMVFSDAHLSGIAGAEVEALIHTGDLHTAFAHAEHDLTRDPARFEGWPALVAAVAASDDPTADDVLVDALQAATTGSCSTALVQRMAPRRSLQIFLRYFAAGGEQPAVIRDSIVAAIAARDTSTLGHLVPASRLLSPDVVETLAEQADRRMLTEIAAAFRADLRERLVPFVVCGAPHSGLGWTADVLTRLGHGCGHLDAFDAFHNTTAFGPLQGEASWMALPFIDDLPPRSVIFHQVREPLSVIRGLLRSRLLTATSPERGFVNRHHAGVLDHDDEVRRCMALWLRWNTGLDSFGDGDRPYVRYRVEDLDADALAQLAPLLGGCMSPSEAALRTPPPPEPRSEDDGPRTFDELPAGPLRDEVRRLASSYGYELQPATTRAWSA